MNEVTLAYWLGGIVCGICGIGIGWIFGRKWGIYIGTVNAVADMLAIPGVSEAVNKEVDELYARLLEDARNRHTAETEREDNNAEGE